MSTLPEFSLKATAFLHSPRIMTPVLEEGFRSIAGGAGCEKDASDQLTFDNNTK